MANVRFLYFGPFPAGCDETSNLVVKTRCEKLCDGVPNERLFLCLVTRKSQSVVAKYQMFQLADASR